MKRYALILAAFFIVISFSIQTADATIIHEASGISAKGVNVSFKAELTISGNLLTIVLTNTSPVNTLNPDDTLGSFYFDILNSGGNRPALTYASATGDIYLASKTNPDTLYEAGADLKALPGGRGWIFKTMDEIANPYLGFGIGTVGNSNLSPNDFPSMDGVETSIYKGEITTQNLNNKKLVKETAIFTFTGLNGFTEANIVPQFAFGLGTMPDSILTPEPATMVLLGLGGLLLGKRK
jgi:hypothetical protein